MPALIGARLGALLLASASTACAFGALGVSLYPHPAQWVAAGLLFGAAGLLTGLLLMALPMAFDGLPAQARLAAGQDSSLAPSPLAVMAHATLAAMQSPRRPPAAAPAPAPAAPAHDREAVNA